jgi:hypothetical protein
VNFHEFLNFIKNNNSIKSSSEFYEFLGGESSLEMSLRNFQSICSGKQIPTVKNFLNIFRTLDSEYYKTALISFFSSNTNVKLDSNFINFLDNHTSAAFKTEETSIWDTKYKRIKYTEQQLNFLTQNMDCQRLHHNLILWEHIPQYLLRDKKELAKKLINEGLAVIGKDGIYTPGKALKVPNIDDSPPSAVRKATRYILSLIQNYISEEGSPKQKLSFAIQLVDETKINLILEEMEKFKKWVQSMGSQKTDSSVVPFVLVSFGKCLEKRELE